MKILPTPVGRQVRRPVDEDGEGQPARRRGLRREGYPGLRPPGGCLCTDVLGGHALECVVNVTGFKIRSPRNTLAYGGEIE